MSNNNMVYMMIGHY